MRMTLRAAALLLALLTVAATPSAAAPVRLGDDSSARRDGVDPSLKIGR